jgi:triosephosphate isomerase
MAQKDVDGLLVGSASLDPAVFAGVVKNGLKSRT